MNVLVLAGSTGRATLDTILARLLVVALPDDLTQTRHDLAGLPHVDADLESADCLRAP